MAERIQKVLAQAGVASRREIDRWLAEGRIAVDGAVAKPGDRLTHDQAVSVDGKPVELTGDKARTRVLIYNKPAGELVTRADPQGRPTVFDALPAPDGGRWIAVGRLDLATTGLLLLTTDGTLAHELMHPSRELRREYLVRVHGSPDDAVLKKLRKGIALDDGPARFERLERRRGGKSSNTWFRVSVREGRNRLVRRLWEAAGFRVSRLMRTRFGPVELPRNLSAGEFVEANAATRKALKAAGRLDG